MKISYLIKTLFLLFLSNMTSAEELFSRVGSYDNVKSSDSGHCHGTSISLWKLNNDKIIGLLDIHSGLCGDPACSILKGSINNNKISFNTSVPIYNEIYSFVGEIFNAKLSGTLNNLKATLRENTFIQTYQNISSWCSDWSKISRCSGVKKYCQ